MRRKAVGYFPVVAVQVQRLNCYKGVGWGVGSGSDEEAAAALERMVDGYGDSFRMRYGVSSRHRRVVGTPSAVA